MPPLRSFRQKSRSFSKRRKFSDAVQREVKRLLPTIIQTVNQHNMQNHTPHPSPTTPCSPSPPPFHSPLRSSPRNQEVVYMTNVTPRAGGNGSGFPVGRKALGPLYQNWAKETKLMAKEMSSKEVFQPTKWPNKKASQRKSVMPTESWHMAEPRFE
ncbi:hypothetical protein E3N88_31709 [Mikania micrantha]|uniref:Uncharacterized protein n=1 Tax=Mikania micrantha TaxID=192012 RepID=A0A5N6M6G0_9ASTR|nr:hypothetical protein E3N88_31709 [Mikania micrantha]